MFTPDSPNLVTAPEPAPASLPRYQRTPETPRPAELEAVDHIVPWEQAADAVERSSLSPGSRALLLGLLRTGSARMFPGGGAGIEYGSLLKTAARPDDLAGHIQEAAAHFRSKRVDLLVVPGMSGYPIGAMYALAGGLPAILLKKSKLTAAEAETYPPGAFIIPSYTGEGDVVMSADPVAALDIVGLHCARQTGAQAGEDRVTLTLRCAGADDIIDKATMSQAVGESAVVVGETAIDHWIARHRERTGDDRPIERQVELVAWATPLIKLYNNPQKLLQRWFGLEAFAGVSVTGLHLDPPAIEVQGAGWFAFADR